jgi:hypothetical protein
MTLTLLTTTLVFWLAHLWSEVMGVRLAGTVPHWSDVRRVAVSEWPVVEAGFVPNVLLALAWAGLYSRDTGAELAMIAAVLQLAAWGFAAGWRTQHRLAPAIVTSAVDCAFGLAIDAQGYGPERIYQSGSRASSVPGDWAAALPGGARLPSHALVAAARQRRMVSGIDAEREPVHGLA